MAAILSIAALSGHAERITLWSKGNRYKALIVNVHPSQKSGVKGSIIYIEDADGNILSSRKYTGVGLEGYYVAHASWTFDGRYFVYSMYSAGGRRPFHYPIHFFDSKAVKFYYLDALFEETTDALFSVRAPAIVEYRVKFIRVNRVNLSKLSNEDLDKAWTAEGSN